LHNSDREHGNAPFPAACAIESEFHHLDSLFHLTFNVEVQYQSADVAGHNDEETDFHKFIAFLLLNLYVVVWVRIQIFSRVFLKLNHAIQARES
jgi:hypothetical protein